MPSITVSNGTFSPHSRGYAPGCSIFGNRFSVLPALAGVCPTPPAPGGWPGRSPRTRGGMPQVGRRSAPCAAFSPHSRGYAHRPHRPKPHRPVLPALAGVCPRASACPSSRARSPRTRGGMPFDLLAAVREIEFSPHSRGYARGRHHHTLPRRFSPHSRGYARPRRRQVPGQQVLPALAGVCLAAALGDGAALGSPRTRGGMPSGDRLSVTARPFSPHSRGYARYRGGRGLSRLVLPALAGVCLHHST